MYVIKKFEEHLCVAYALKDEISGYNDEAIKVFFNVEISICRNLKK